MVSHAWGGGGGGDWNPWGGGHLSPHAPPPWIKPCEVYGVRTDGVHSTSTDDIDTTPNDSVYEVITDGIETTPNEVYGVHSTSTDGIETTPNEVYGVNADRADLVVFKSHKMCSCSVRLFCSYS